MKRNMDLCWCKVKVFNITSSFDKNGNHYWVFNQILAGNTCTSYIDTSMLEGRIAKKLPAGRIEGKEERNFFSTFFFFLGGVGLVFVKNKFPELTFSNFPFNLEETYEKPLKKVLRILQKVVPLLLWTRMQDPISQLLLANPPSQLSFMLILTAYIH